MKYNTDYMVVLLLLMQDENKFGKAYDLNRIANFWFGLYNCFDKVKELCEMSYVIEIKLESLGYSTYSIAPLGVQYYNTFLDEFKQEIPSKFAHKLNDIKLLF